MNRHITPHPTSHQAHITAHVLNTSNHNSRHVELYQQIDSHDALLAHSHRLDSARKLLGCVNRYKSGHRLSSHDDAFELHKRDTMATANGQRRCRPFELSSPPVVEEPPPSPPCGPITSSCRAIIAIFGRVVAAPL